MKKMLCGILSLVMVTALLSGCSGKKDQIELRELQEYFFETSTYTDLDYDFVNEHFAKENDNWSGGGCSAISAIVDGTRMIGRNMDLNISNKCAYVVRTKAPDKYETFGLMYTFRDYSPDYEDVKKNGLDDTFSRILPFLCDDVVNSEGLHIEINMRHGEQDAEGRDVIGVEHTNPDAKDRLFVFNLVQYIGLNCRDLEEVRDYIAHDVDVYSKHNYWNYCFIISDAAGNSALLEFGNGTYYWTETDENGVVAQTNFYVNEECYALEDTKSGLGRYETLMQGIGAVKTKQDLYELMKKVQYSSFYLPYDECKSEHFDQRSEIIGEENELDIDMVYDIVMDPENEWAIREYENAYGASVRALTREQKRADNAYWESTFTEVVNPKERMIEVRLYEDDSALYRITFDGTEKISEIR